MTESTSHIDKAKVRRLEIHCRLLDRKQVLRFFPGRKNCRFLMCTCAYKDLCAQYTYIPTKVFFTFLVSAVAPGCVETSEHSELGGSDDKGHAMFVIMDVGCLTQCDLFLFHLLTCDSYFLSSCRRFHSVYVPHFHYSLVS